MLAFTLGLAVGFVFLIWQRIHFSKQLQQLLGHFGQENLPLYLSKISRLTMAVAQQQHRQRELQELLSSVQQLINHAPIAYLQVDRDNHLLWCNQEASNLVEIDDPSPTTPRLLLEQVRSYDLDQLIEVTRKHQQIHQRQWVIHPVKADPFNPVTRNSLYLMGYGIPLPDEQVGVFLENRQEIVKLSQQRDRWVSDVAHELKTPLTSIRLVAEMLESRVDPGLSPWLQRLLGEVIHLSNLVHDLLDLSRLERGATRVLEITSTDLPQLVERAWDSLEPIHASKQMCFQYLGPSSLEIEVDPNRFYRVLINLLDNAVKYSPAASAIQVSVALTQTPSPSLVLDVIDTGPGFPEDSIEQVFERFYRADPARTRISRGDALASEQFSAHSSGMNEGAAHTSAVSINSCGLGLAIVRQIVEAHSGEVRAQNHPETHGAWIQIKLPVIHASCS